MTALKQAFDTKTFTNANSSGSRKKTLIFNNDTQAYSRGERVTFRPLKTLESLSVTKLPIFNLVWHKGRNVNFRLNRIKKKRLGTGGITHT